MQGIQDIAKTHPLIGDVRGSGLFIGVEIIRDDELNTPDAEMTSKIVNALRHKGVLIGSDGNHHNVLKIRPPMVFSKDNVCLFLDRFRGVLKEIT